MLPYLAQFSAIAFVAATFLALVGTNNQAAVAKLRLRADPNAAVVRAGQLWQASRMLVRKRVKAELRALEAEIMNDPQAWQRYQILCRDLFAWNALETSVAIAFVAAMCGGIAEWMQI